MSQPRLFFAKGDSLPVLRFIAGAISADDSQVSSADLIVHLGIIFRVIAHEAYCESCHWLWSLSKAGHRAGLESARGECNFPQMTQVCDHLRNPCPDG